MTRHRAECTACEWRHGENCADCLEDRAARHRTATGHPVEVRITTAENLWELLENRRLRKATSRLMGW